MISFAAHLHSGPTLSSPNSNATSADYTASSTTHIPTDPTNTSAASKRTWIASASSSRHDLTEESTEGNKGNEEREVIFVREGNPSRTDRNLSSLSFIPWVLMALSWVVDWLIVGESSPFHSYIHTHEGSE